MRRVSRQTVVTPTSVQDVKAHHSIKTPAPSSPHAQEHLLQPKRQTLYEEYQQLMRVEGWSPDHELAACEKAFASYCGVPHAVLFCSESVALQLLLEALNLSVYDRLYIPENIPYAYYKAASHTLATQHAMVIDPVSRTIDLSALGPQLRKQVTRGHDVIIASHIAGACFPLMELEQLICDPQACIIEDATESCGAKETAGTMVGSCHGSLATLFSFSSGSLLDVGGGGAITTRDPELDKKLRLLRQRGALSKAPEPHNVPLIDSKEYLALSIPQAMLLHAQLQQDAKCLSELLDQRRQALLRYLSAQQTAFAGISRERQPVVLESLLDARAAPSQVLLKLDCVPLAAHKQQVIPLFHRHGLTADWGSSWRVKTKIEQIEQQQRPSSCFTSLRVALDVHRTSNELLALFRSLRELLVRS